MVISELKKDAKIKLTSIYFKVILINLVYLIIVGILETLGNMISNKMLLLVYQILMLIIALPFSYGLIASMLKLSRNEDVSITDFITTGLNNMKKVWQIFGRTLLKVILPIILFIITAVISILAFSYSVISSANPAIVIISLILFVAATIYYIVKLLSYILTNYILYDNPELSAKEIVEKSERLMNTHKWDYIILCLSFIGWILLIYLCTSLLILFVNEILGSIAFFIFYLALVPYVSFSMINFYEELNSSKKENASE